MVGVEGVLLVSLGLVFNLSRVLSVGGDAGEDREAGAVFTDNIEVEDVGVLRVFHSLHELTRIFLEHFLVADS